MPSPHFPPTRLRSILDAARLGGRDSVLAAVEGVDLSAGSDASIDELWLAAEVAYLRGDYRVAIERFRRFDRHPGAIDTQPWQRYMSAHRQSYGSFELGRYDQSRRALEKAEQLVRDHRDLDPRQPDLEAMHAHLLEVAGQVDQAEARFLLAHKESVTRGNWRRAATTANDIGQLAGEHGRLAEALEWFDRAEEALNRSPDRRVGQSNGIRRARVLRAAQRPEAAAVLYDRLLADAVAAQNPAMQAQALTERAGFLVERRQFEAALQDLEEAVKILRQTGYVRREVQARRALAKALLARGNREDLTRAVTEFRSAVRVTFTAYPVPPRLLLQLAEDAASDRRLLGLGLDTAGLQKRLEAAANTFRQAATPMYYRLAGWSQQLRAAEAELLASLEACLDQEIRLRSWTILRGRRRLEPASKGAPRKTRRIGLELVRLIEILYSAGPSGLESISIADRLNKSMEATYKLLERLESVIGDDLHATPHGRFRKYSVLRRE